MSVTTVCIHKISDYSNLTSPVVSELVVSAEEVCASSRFSTNAISHIPYSVSMMSSRPVLEQNLSFWRRVGC